MDVVLAPSPHQAPIEKNTALGQKTYGISTPTAFPKLVWFVAFLPNNGWCIEFKIRLILFQGTAGRHPKQRDSTTAAPFSINVWRPHPSPPVKDFFQKRTNVCRLETAVSGALKIKAYGCWCGNVCAHLRKRMPNRFKSKNDVRGHYHATILVIFNHNADEFVLVCGIRVMEIFNRIKPKEPTTTHPVRFRCLLNLISYPHFPFREFHSDVGEWSKSQGFTMSRFADSGTRDPISLDMTLAKVGIYTRGRKTDPEVDCLL